MDRADVLLQVNLTQFPAHTPFLASKCRFVAKLLEDLSPLDQHKPLMICSFLDGYSLREVSTFLLHIYKDLPVESEKDAWDLLPIADHFDCPALIEKAAQVIERSTGSIFLLEDRHRNKDLLDWWHMARRFGLKNFERACVTYVAARFEELQYNPRLLQMPPQALLLLLAKMHSRISKHMETSSLCSPSHRRVGIW